MIVSKDKAADNGFFIGFKYNSVGINKKIGFRKTRKALFQAVLCNIYIG